MKNNKNRSKLDVYNQSELIFWSFRYFLGRQSYAVSGFCNNLAACFDDLDANIAALIKRELDDAFRNDDRDRENKMDYRALGGDCDRASWQKVKDAYTKK